MQTARRLYLYVMSGVTLAVIAVGLAILLEVAIGSLGIFDRASYGYYASSQERLSQAIAMLGVGIPVWAIHWRLAQRGIARAGIEGGADRGSAVRAFYLTIALAISLVVWVTGAADSLRALVLQASGVGGDVFTVDPVGAASRTIVALLVWLYHGTVRRSDLRSAEVHGAAAWIPRLYLYGVSLAALWAAIEGIGTLASSLLQAPRVGFETDYALVDVINGTVGLVAWGLVWAGHWRYATRLAAAGDWRGQAEQASRTRLAAFIASIVVAAGFATSGLADVISALIASQLPNDPDLGVYTSPAGPAVAVVVPLAITIPWAVAWWAHTRWLSREPAAAEPLRALHQARLETHGVSMIALALGATAFAWLLGLVIDVAFGGNRTAEAYGLPWTYQVAQWLPMAVVGLAVWAWQWTRVRGRRRHSPTDEANSTIRRTFLYLTLAGALVAALGSAAVILYRLVGSALGAGLAGDAVSELSTPLGVLITAGIGIAYHGLLLRSDQALRLVPVAEAPPATPRAGVPPTAPEHMTTTPASASLRRFELVAPDGGDVEAALEAARAGLPDGFTLREITG